MGKFLCGNECKLKEYSISYYYLPCNDNYCDEYEKYWSSINFLKNIDMDLNLKEIIKNNIVRFSHYRASYLYYHITVNELTYSFPVPIEDIGDATFLNEDKAIIMMRYIRKAIEDKTFVKV
jgi:hypothetical protein